MVALIAWHLRSWAAAFASDRGDRWVLAGILIDNCELSCRNILGRLNRGRDSPGRVRRAICDAGWPLGIHTATTLASVYPDALGKGGTADFTRGIPVMIIAALTIAIYWRWAWSNWLAAFFSSTTSNR